MDKAILAIVELFEPQFEGGVPITELMSQLHLLGWWPNLKGKRGINIRVYAAAEKQLHDAAERLKKSGRLDVRQSTYFRLAA